MSISNYVDGTTLKRKINEVYQNINTSFIGVILSSDQVNARYNVKPVLKEYDLSGIVIDRATIVSCPICFQKCGDFYIRMPYKVGDMVYVGINQESVDESIISNSIRPNRLTGVSRFRYVDGVILGGIMSDKENTLSGENIEDFIIQNRTNNDKIVIRKTNGIEVTSSTIVDVNAETVNIKATTVNITADNTNVSGNLNVSKNIVVSGTGAIEGAVQAGSLTTKAGITMDNHIHSYTDNGSPLKTGKGEG